METQIQQTPWTVDEFVGTPDIIDNNDCNDYFTFNPNPQTPRYITTDTNSYTQPHSHGQHQFHQQQQHSYTHPGTFNISPNSFTQPQTHPQPGFNQAQNQFPSNGEFNLHRSTSFDNFSVRSESQSTSHRSNSSISSHLSLSSNSNFNWGSSSENDDSISLTTSISPSLIGGQIDVDEKGGNKHGRIPSLNLSIDPNLFKSHPKKKASNVEGEGDDEGDEIEMLETAKPKSSITKKDKKKEDLIGISPLNKNGKTKNVRKERNKKNNGNKDGGEGGEGKKVSHARKQTADHIPRPRNAFILFRKHVVDSKLIPASVEMRHQNVSIITAKMWSEASPDQKAHFNDLARIEKEEHLKKYPGYRYQPVYRRTNVIRRRVRKDEAEEQKCKSVAELLIKGKSGEALENEIKLKIKKGGNSSSGSSTKHSIEVLPDLKAQEQSNSRRSSAACELSKGALRALRAQARQQSSSHGSGDWSDISTRGRGRSDSLALSIDPTKTRSRPVSRQSYSFGFEDNVDSTNEEGDEYENDNNNDLFNLNDNNGNNGDTQMLGYGFAPSQVQGFVRQQQQQQQQENLWGDLGYMNGEFHINSQPQQTQMYSNENEQSSFHQPGQLQQGIHNFSFPATVSIPNHSSIEYQIHQQQPNSSFPETSNSFNSDPTSSSSSASATQLLYPQPGQLHLPQTTTTKNDFYTYDTALPFSPSIANFSFQNNFSDNQNQNHNINGGNMYSDSMESGNGEGIYEFTLPDNTTQNQNQFIDNENNDQFQINNFWDMNKNNNNLSLLPPSSGVPLENLPFDDHFILGDFEAALAHADEAGDDLGSASW